MTSIVSIVELSDVFLMRIFPASTSTGSEKLRTILLSTPTSVSLLAGDELLKVGLMVSIVVKERLVLSPIPAKEWPALSSKAVAGICR